MSAFGPGGAIPPKEAAALAGKLRAACTFVAQILSDEPTSHDLEVVGRHIPACQECSILYAEYYLSDDEANRGTA